MLLCGPPGAGKTTRAHELAADGLQVLDRDDPQWAGERAFTLALAAIGGDPDARAVVIRSGATEARRLQAAQLINATEVEVLMPPAEVCRDRVIARRRPDWQRSLAGVGKWFDEHEHDINRPAGAAEAHRQDVRPSRKW